MLPPTATRTARPRQSVVNQFRLYSRLQRPYFHLLVLPFDSASGLRKK